MINKIRQHLIDDWKLFFKFWSVQLDIIAAVLGGVMIAFPDAALYVWSQFPPDLKAMIPTEWTPYISVSLLVASLLARAIKQPKLKAKDES